MNTRAYTNIIQRTLLALVMIATSVCTWAEDGDPDPNVAKIGETKYETLQAAIDAANANTTETTVEITLLKDVTIESTLLISKDITINGQKGGGETGNYTITSSVNNTLGAFYINTNTCNFTIKNTTIDGNKTGSMAVCAYRGVAENGTITNVEHKGNSGNIITLQNCTVQNFTGWPGSFVGAVYGFSESTVNLTNCTFKDNTTSQSSAENSASGADVWVGAAGTLNINGGSLQEAFANSNSTDNVTVSITGGAIVAELSICVSYKDDGTTHIPTITIDNATVTDLKTEVANTPLPSNPVTLQNNGTITNTYVTEVAKILNGTSTKAFTTLSAAFEAATSGQTNMSLLTDVTEEITVSSGRDITLSMGSHKITGTITNNGTLSLKDGGEVTGTITIAAAPGTVTIANGVTHGGVVLATELNGYVLKTISNNDASTTFRAEGIVTAEVSSSITETALKNAADALVTNSSISTVEGLATNQSLIITVKEVRLDGSSNVTAATFEVVLKDANDNNVTGTTSEITFRLPISSAIDADKWVNLWHNTTATPGTTVQGSDDNKYVEVKTTTFSPFSYEIIDTPIAQIGETKYESVNAAVNAATSEATVITLLANETEAITVEAEKNISLDIPDNVTISGAITNSGTLAISNGTISGTVTASAGTLNISGGTISSTITTSGSAALTISGGTISGAVSVGGSDANTISGGDFTAAVTTSEDATISGGTFSQNVEVSAGTLTISGGTFTGEAKKAASSTGTLAISGGTHTVLPIKDYCASGFMPIPEGSKFTMTNEWNITDVTVIDYPSTQNASNAHFAYLTTDAGYTVKTAIYHRNTGMQSAGSADTKYGTICLPFEIKANPAGVSKLYKATSITESALTIEEVTTDIPAGTPLIFELSSAATSMTLTSSKTGGVISVNTENPATTTATGNLLIGTYTPTELTGDALTDTYYINGDKFHHAVAKLTVPAFRAYLKAPAAQPARPATLSIVKEGEQTTGILQTVSMEGVTEVYDLNGRKQSGLQRGVNIMRRTDGSTMKVIVK